VRFLHRIQIELENLSTNKRYTFHCNRWLATDEDDGSIVREIPAEGDDIKRPQSRTFNTVLFVTDVFQCSPL